MSMYDYTALNIPEEEMPDEQMLRHLKNYWLNGSANEPLLLEDIELERKMQNSPFRNILQWSSIPVSLAYPSLAGIMGAGESYLNARSDKMIKAYDDLKFFLGREPTQEEYNKFYAGIDNKEENVSTGIDLAANALGSISRVPYAREAMKKGMSVLGWKNLPMSVRVPLAVGAEYGGNIAQKETPVYADLLRGAF